MNLYSCVFFMLAYLRYIVFGFCFLSAVTLWAGLQPVTIVVRDDEKLPLIGATVQLTHLDDETSKFSTTDHMGVARFEAVDNASFFVHIRYMGFLPLERYISVSPGRRVFEFQLQADVVALGEVTVTARRPLIRQEDDRMIIDPEPLANISTNTLEILEKTPGLFVDEEAGVFLGSTTPAAIYINGREQKMSNQDINTILRALPPGSVQHIEVLRTPSSRFDAASSGGIINIVLKKGIRIGRFGSVNAGMNQGAYGNRFAGFSLNNSGDRTTTYLNANYSHTGRVDDLNAVRFLATDTTLSQTAQSIQRGNQGYVGFGMSYDAGPDVVLNYDGRVNASRRHSDVQNINLILAPQNQRISENNHLSNNRNGFFSTQQDLGVLWRIDTLGSELDTRFGYSFNAGHTGMDYRTNFLAPTSHLVMGEGDNSQRRHFIQMQSDLTYVLPHRIRLETGVKSTYQHYDSDADYYFNMDGELVTDPSRTNAFNYQERINAVYAQGSVPLPGRLLLKAGLRLEHTFMEGNQTVPSDTSFVVNRADLFPYLYLSRPVVEIAGYELRAYAIYRRTIGRPGYQQLNPYIRFVDQYLYETGNPGLRPQFSENMEVNVSFDDTPIFAIGQNRTRDIFSGVVYQDPQWGNVAIRTFDNVGQSRKPISGLPVPSHLLESISL
jgi:iron complex outermembrane recepter protein